MQMSYEMAMLVLWGSLFGSVFMKLAWLAVGISIARSLAKFVK